MRRLLLLVLVLAGCETDDFFITDGDAACSSESGEVARGQHGLGLVVEHAFADRFGLARARHDASSQRRLWQAYLERFPRGSFADDARAGLCRSEPEPARGACWARYLEAAPSSSTARSSSGPCS